MDDLDPILVDKTNFFFSVFWGDHLDRTGEVGVHAPLSDVEVMGSHVRQVAVAVFAIGPPAREMVMDVVGAKSLVVSAGRGRALPGIPVDALGHFFGREVTWFRRTSHAYADLLDLPDCTAPDELDGLAEFPTEFRALLATGEESDLVIVHRFDHRPSFLDGQGNWLFAVNVLFRPGGQDGWFPMPMVGGCDEHGVDLFVGQ